MKTVYRLNDGQYSKIGEHESWFHDMAQKGLHLQDIGKRLIRFEKGEPKETFYRILIVPKDSLTDESIAEYANRGWAFITTYNRYGKLEFAVFSSPPEKNAEEIEIAPEVLEQYYNPGKNASSQKRLLAAVILTSVAAFLVYVPLFKTPFLIQYIDAGHKFIYYYVIFLIPVLLWVLFIAAKAVVYRIKKKNISGIILPVDHNAPWVKLRRAGLLQVLFWRTYRALFYLFLFVSAVMGEYTTVPGDNLPAAVKNIPIVASLIRVEEKNLSEGTDSLPVIHLADIERDLQYEKVPAHMSNGVDLNNSYSFTTTNCLASLKLFSFENGYEHRKSWSASFTPYLETRVYLLKHEAMSSILVTDLAKELINANKNGNAVKISNPAFDKLMVHEGNYYKFVIAAKGKSVFYVRYSGDATFDTIISAVAEKINSISG